MGKTPRKKLIIIGLDGGTFSAIDPLIGKGRLPNLERIIKSGVRGILKSTYPPITAAAWVSFMTGKNPGKHGYFDFREYNPADYTPAFVPTTKDAVNESISSLHSSRFQGQTIWDYLSEAGYEMTVVAVPMTYPPWRINGRMVPGFPCPGRDRPKTYPPAWGKEIGKLLDMSAISSFNAVSRRTPGEFTRECKELVRREAGIITDHMRKGMGDVYSVVFSSTDFAQHYFWRFFEERDHPDSRVIEEIYAEIDRALGEISSLMDDDTSLVIISDHGFMRHPARRFNISAWLRREGYIYLNRRGGVPGVFPNLLNVFLGYINQKNVKLRMRIREKVSRMPHFIQKWASRQYSGSNLIDWDKTKAFRFKMYANVEGIVINLRGRQEKGIVGKGEEYESLREEIIAKLLDVKDPETGNQVVAKAYKREEIYKGDFIEKTPDIVISFSPDYAGGQEQEGPVITRVPEDITGYFSGIHSRDGIFIFCGRNVRKGAEIKPADIVDVLPTILYDLNLPIPDDLDGKIIEEAFTESFRVNQPEYVRRGKGPRRAAEELSWEDEESMKSALKGLGYLD